MLASPLLASALQSISSGLFSPAEPARYRSLVEDVQGHDPFTVGADFDAYWQAQRAVDAAWREPASWWRKSILNTARMGWFSSDRTIREYAADIWGVKVK